MPALALEKCGRLSLNAFKVVFISHLIRVFINQCHVLFFFFFLKILLLRYSFGFGVSLQGVQPLGLLLNHTLAAEEAGKSWAVKMKEGVLSTMG